MGRDKSGERKLNSSQFIDRFDPDVEFELQNKTSEDVDLKREFMYFLSEKCTGKNHGLDKSGIGKIKIHTFKVIQKKVGSCLIFRACFIAQKSSELL